ncbi:MAG: hypothetical protein IPG12_09280 [Saprospiraceae bacterium]|nr:hypothetical protein [Saprospiraceae bacterium]
MISKIFQLVFYIAIFQLSINAQRQNMNWVIGYNNISEPSIFGRVLLNFTQDTLSIIPTQGGHRFYMGFENTSYSDKFGILMFYFDGFNLGNKEHKIVENGDTLNPGTYWDDYQGAFYPIANASLFLTIEGNGDLIYLIHKRKIWDSNLNLFYSDKLYYTLIATKENGGLGKVLTKNQVILEGNFVPSQMAVCKHANGKFWWIINHDYWNSIYYKVLLTDTGFVKFTPQAIGVSLIDRTDNGNLIISYDGKKLVRTSLKDHLQIMDFDRCTGEISNFNQYSIPDLDSFRTINSCLSPNSKYLYVISTTNIYQYDLESNDIEHSFIQVAKWDGFIYDKYFSTAYYDIQNAPDNKMYVSCISGNIYLHAINKPNERGLDCDFQHRAIELPVYNGIGLPNFANFDLGVEQGSICDSLTATNDFNSKLPFKIYPNPSDGILQIVNQNFDNNKSLDVHLIDISGNIVFKKSLLQYKNNGTLN